MKDLILASLAAFTLAACGGSGSAVIEDAAAPEVDEAVGADEDAAPTEIVLAPANGNLGPNNVAFATSESGIEVFVTIDGTTKSFTSISPVLQQLGLNGDLDTSFNIVAGVDLAAFTSEFLGDSKGDQNKIALAFVGGTEAATTSVGVFLEENPESARIQDATVTTGAAFARLTETALPLTGGATFEGDYVSVLLPTDLTEVDVQAENIAIGGNVTLNADFANAVISGAVTDREFLGLIEQSLEPIRVIEAVEVIEAASSNRLADITFAETSIDDAGAFAGIASADASVLNGAGLTTEDGAFSGLIAGANGDQAVGAVALTHTLGDETFTELGSFAAQ